MAFASFLAAIVLAECDLYNQPWAWSYMYPVWRWNHFVLIYEWHWHGFTEFFLAGGMLAATLLIYRVLGYRLSKMRSPQFSSSPTAESRLPTSRPAAEAAGFA